MKPFRPRPSSQPARAAAAAVSDPPSDTAAVPPFAEPPEHLGGIARIAWRGRNEEYEPSDTAPEWLRARVNGTRLRNRLESKGIAVDRLAKAGLLVRIV